MIEKTSEYSIKTGGYGTTCGIDVDYDNPDVEKIKIIVLNDFSRKLLSIYNEYMYAMPNALFMYGIFERRYYDVVDMSITQEYKKDFLKFADCNEVASYVFDYFKKYYIGPSDMQVNSFGEIRKWWSYGEFPFIYVHLFRNMDGQVSMNYTLSR